MSLSVVLVWVMCSDRALLYIVVQTVGAVAGAGVLKGLSANNTNNALCTPAPRDDVSGGQVFGIEMFITFILVFTVFATCDSLRSGFGGSGPLAIGLSLTMCHLWAVRSLYTHSRFCSSFAVLLCGTFCNKQMKNNVIWALCLAEQYVPRKRTIDIIKYFQPLTDVSLPHALNFAMNGFHCFESGTYHVGLSLYMLDLVVLLFLVVGRNVL